MSYSSQGKASLASFIYVLEFSSSQHYRKIARNILFTGPDKNEFWKHLSPLSRVFIFIRILICQNASFHANLQAKNCFHFPSFKTPAQHFPKRELLFKKKKMQRQREDWRIIVNTGTCIPVNYLGFHDGVYNFIRVRMHQFLLTFTSKNCSQHGATWTPIQS